MGYMRHHAILVTASTWQDEANTVREHVVQCATSDGMSLSVSGVVESPINGYASFLVAPDGSKEGWGESNRGDELRGAIIGYLSSSKLYPDWAEVQYGDEGGDNRLLCSS